MTSTTFFDYFFYGVGAVVYIYIWMHVMTPQLLFEIAAIPRELTDPAMSKKWISAHVKKSKPPKPRSGKF